MRSGSAAFVVRRSRALTLGGLVAVLMSVGNAHAAAATLEAGTVDSGIGGMVGVVTVALGVLGLVLGGIRQRRKAAERQAAVPVAERTTIGTPESTERSGGWNTEPLTTPASTVPVRARQRPAPSTSRFPAAGQRLTTR